MNLSLIKHLVMYAAGAGLGGVVGNLIAGKLELDMLEEGVDSLGEPTGTTYYINSKKVTKEEWLAKAVEPVEEETSVIPTDNVVDMGERPLGPVVLNEKTLKNKKKAAVKKPVDYAGITKMSKDIEANIEEVAKAKLGDEAVVKSDAPLIIDMHTFADPGSWNKKVSFLYYADDDVLFDERNNSVVLKPEDLLGEEALVSFGMDPEDPESVYVRNDKLKIDYEIARLHKSYSIDVLGQRPEPEKQAQRSGGRRATTRPSRNVTKVENDDENEGDE